MANVLYGDLSEEHMIYSAAGIDTAFIGRIYACTDDIMAGFIPYQQDSGLWFYAKMYNSRGAGYLSGTFADMPNNPTEKFFDLDYCTVSEFESKSQNGTLRFSDDEIIEVSENTAVSVMVNVINALESKETACLSFGTSRYSVDEHIKKGLLLCKKIISVLPLSIQKYISFVSNGLYPFKVGINFRIVVLPQDYEKVFLKKRGQGFNYKVIDCNGDCKCKEYVSEYARFLADAMLGKEDPRSFDKIAECVQISKSDLLNGKFPMRVYENLYKLKLMMENSTDDQELLKVFSRLFNYKCVDMEKLFELYPKMEKFQLLYMFKKIDQTIKRINKEYEKASQNPFLAKKAKEMIEKNYEECREILTSVKKLVSSVKFDDDEVKDINKKINDADKDISQKFKLILDLSMRISENHGSIGVHREKKQKKILDNIPENSVLNNESDAIKALNVKTLKTISNIRIDKLKRILGPVSIISKALFENESADSSLKASITNMVEECNNIPKEQPANSEFFKEIGETMYSEFYKGTFDCENSNKNKLIVEKTYFSARVMALIILLKEMAKVLVQKADKYGGVVCYYYEYIDIPALKKIKISYDEFLNLTVMAAMYILNIDDDGVDVRERRDDKAYNEKYKKFIKMLKKNKFPEVVEEFFYLIGREDLIRIFYEESNGEKILYMVFFYMCVQLSALVSIDDCLPEKVEVKLKSGKDPFKQLYIKEKIENMAKIIYNKHIGKKGMAEKLALNDIYKYLCQECIKCPKLYERLKF